MPVIDISNFTGRLTTSTVEAWKAFGVQRVIVRASIEDTERILIAQQQIQMCRLLNIPTDVYVWLYWKGPKLAATTLRHFGKYQIGRWWLDCEDDSGGRSPAQLAKRLRDIIHAIGPDRCGIYTRRSWWRLVMKDTKEFSYLPLWVSQPATPPVLDDFISFGGWTQADGKQHKFDTDLGGVLVDMNVWRP